MNFKKRGKQLQMENLFFIQTDYKHFISKLITNNLQTGILQIK